jgi:chromosomal replication initiation ATPase DnaA
MWKDSSFAVLEDIHAITNEAALFHLLRHAENERVFLLLSSRMSAQSLPFTLPDLTSRLRSLPGIQIEAPDQVLLQVFMHKCFSDRQLRVSEDVIAYLVRRIERSFDAAYRVVEAVEHHSSETKRDITIPMVKPLVESA